MTPSAARGILSSIFWKPQFSWCVREIHVLKAIRYFALTRNELKKRIVVSTTMKWATKGGGYFADDDRTQRHILGLRDVAYVIYADMCLNPSAEMGIPKYYAQFVRAIEKGHCFCTPYLGLREFDAFFGPANEDDRPLPISMDLGRMLFDYTFSPDGKSAYPYFFKAELENGVLRVPPYPLKGGSDAFVKIS